MKTFTIHIIYIQIMYICMYNIYKNWIIEISLKIIIIILIYDYDYDDDDDGYKYSRIEMILRLLSTYQPIYLLIYFL